MSVSPRKPWRAAMTVAAAIVAGALASAAYQEAAAARDRRRLPAPGRLVDIGGRRLHLLEAGKGMPTVVIVPALGDNVLVWARIQRELASDMRVCVYDRAGIGWSDPPPRRRRTPGDMADDLRALLDSAGIVPPYVLVAHSLGGVVARRFAARYAAEVAGMLFADSSHEEQAARLGSHDWRYGPVRSYTRALQRQARPLGLCRLAAAVGAARQLDADIAREALPEHADAYRGELLSTRHRRTVVREILMMARLSEAPPSLGTIPLTVITAGGQRLPGWREMQNELAALSTSSTHITAHGSGHYVHLDDPELVFGAIRDLVRRVTSS